jgi:hypothetical protein
LLEHAVVVADAVTASWQPQRGQGVEKTGCQTTETAVAQARVILFVNQLFQIQTHPGQRCFHILIDAQRQ